MASAYVASPLYSTDGSSVSMTLALAAGGNVTGSDDFAAYSSNGAVLALASPRAFGTRYDAGMIELRKPRTERFFLVFTRGDSQTIAGKMESLRLNRMVGSTFGDLEARQADSSPVFLRLEYSDVNILNSAYLGPGSRSIRIRNDGFDGAVTNISFEVER
jgi:hypothetical protein